MADELTVDKKSKYLAQLVSYVYKFFPVIAVFVFLIIAFVSYRFILLPKYNNINSEIKKSIEARTENKEILGRYLQRLKGYEENYSNTPKLSKEKVSMLFNHGYDSEVLFAQFEAIADNQGLILSSLSVQPENKTKAKTRKEADAKSSSGLQTIKISANFIGLNYDGLKTFLTFFENTLPLINITNLNFSDGNSVTIEAETYYLN